MISNLSDGRSYTLINDMNRLHHTNSYILSELFRSFFSRYLNPDTDITTRSEDHRQPDRIFSPEPDACAYSS